MRLLNAIRTLLRPQLDERFEDGDRALRLTDIVIEVRQQQAQLHGLRSLRDGALQQCSCLVLLGVRDFDRRQGTERILITGPQSDRAQAVVQGSRLVALLQPGAGPHRQQSWIVRMPRQCRVDLSDRLLGHAGKHQQAAESGVRGGIVRVDLDSGPVELHGVAHVAEFLRYQAVIEAQRGIVRSDLQRVAELHARLLIVALRKVLLPFRHIGGLAGVGSSATGQQCGADTQCHGNDSY